MIKTSFLIIAPIEIDFGSFSFFSGRPTIFEDSSALASKTSPFSSIIECIDSILPLRIFDKIVETVIWAGLTTESIPNVLTRGIKLGELIKGAWTRQV